MRVAFVGDSLVNGLGDPQFLGWVGRACAAAAAAGVRLTGYNLGVRAENSRHIRNRLPRELPCRLLPREEGRVVLSFGVNDTKVEAGRRDLALSDSVDNLFEMVTQTARTWPVLVVGPPPVRDDGHRERIAELSAVFANTCEDMGVPYLDMFNPLIKNVAFLDDLAAGIDGFHPGAVGYAAMAEVFMAWDAWRDWLCRG